MIKKTGMFAFILLLFMAFHLFCEELPRPSYDNSAVFSFTYSLPNAPDSEIQYIKSQFGGGLYAPLTISNFSSVNMSWFLNPGSAANGISNIKRFVESLIPKARSHGIGLHISLSYGMARSVNYYKDAKEEDIRNAQWYNDNNLATLSQLSRVTGEDEPVIGEEFYWRPPYAPPDEAVSGVSSSASGANINAFVYTTPSRYARKLRAHLEAKARAAFDYINQVQARYPDLLIILSAPGEAELNALRQDNKTWLQAFFCDYSPFAVLEFRDWIKHEGMYASGRKYGGQGYAGGGARYRGGNGLLNFNNDFGTAFNSWDLKYYNWSLADPVDTDYTDTANPDPNIIPVGQYTYGGMMPASGSGYTGGGFDPPRLMKQKGEDAFWDLWNEFREAMVRHYVLDMVTVARQSGFAMNRYYTHQIAADYLFGTRPDDPAIPYLNQRYYTSASPLSTAVSYPDTGMGVTMYDINFGTWYARTSQYMLPVISSMAEHWGVMEYNPEILAKNVTINTVDNIYNRMKMLYDYNAHFLGFYKWESNPNEQYKGTNREEAAKRLFDAVKDKARRGISTVFTPPEITGLVGTFNSTTGAVSLSWSSKIWNDLSYTWPAWGDFKEFVVYRGKTAGFTANASSETGRTTAYTYTDSGAAGQGALYYKVAAVHVTGQRGTPAQVSVDTGGVGGSPVLNVSKTRLAFGSAISGPTTPPQIISVSNSGAGVLSWSVSDNADWLRTTPVSGVGSGLIQVTADASGKGPGTYTGTITVSAPGASGSPSTVSVTLHVYAAGQDAVPFGLFETPEHGASVSSSIAVTGWVLDDIGVESVKLYRQEGIGALKYIGDAIMVEGARPDVEGRYPTYPNNTKAGWGYMLLTNFLPNGGNGAYTLLAIARDVTGHEVTLGVKTVYSDNQHAVKPFGAIDTPTQGGTASGSKFVNFGWVLTPQPNHIPIDGSTIDVFIDGVKMGRPVYNNYRKDIAALFPGYANSQAAIGYYYIDTNAYTNGVHTIAWSARDSAGNGDGIGSRYFTIRNTGSRVQHSTSAAHMFRDSKTGLKTDGVMPVLVRRGYGDGVFQQVQPAGNGVIEVNIKQMERVVMDFLGEVHTLSPLPIGATLDSKNGVLYWQPGMAHFGEYTFHLGCKTGNGKPVKKTIVINIGALNPTQ
jgi:hypothetical protein